MLFIYLEFGVTVLEEGVDLTCGGNAGVDIGFCRLCTHLLGRGEIAAYQLLEVGIGIGHDVGDILQVSTLVHQGKQFWLIDDFLSCGVDKDATLAEFSYEIAVDPKLL